jgi:hypothetical protein
MKIRDNGDIQGSVVFHIEKRHADHVMLDVLDPIDLLDKAVRSASSAVPPAKSEGQRGLDSLATHCSTLRLPRGRFGSAGGTWTLPTALTTALKNTQSLHEFLFLDEILERNWADQWIGMDYGMMNRIGSRIFFVGLSMSWVRS